MADEFEKRFRETTGLARFMQESNRIEGEEREARTEELEAHQQILYADHLTIEHLAALAVAATSAEKGRLRDDASVPDVRVGTYTPPESGPEIRQRLEDLLSEINQGFLSPWEAHLRYEALHPFLDGNGRTGRAIWAWMMRQQGQSPFSLPFLHAAYYQALSHSQRIDSRLDRERNSANDSLRRLIDAREELWMCLVAAGDDPDGETDGSRLNPGEAIDAVRDLRQRYEECLGELRREDRDED